MKKIFLLFVMSMVMMSYSSFVFAQNNGRVKVAPKPKTNSSSGEEEQQKKVRFKRKKRKKKINKRNAEPTIVASSRKRLRGRVKKYTPKPYIPSPRPSTPEPDPEPSTPISELPDRVEEPDYPNNTNLVAEGILQEAEKYMGTRYVYGGESPRTGFDCSGFVQYVYDKEGIDLPRTSYQQAREGEKVAIRKAQKGDLVFFGKTGEGVSHVGIVTSNGGEPLTMIHAASSQGVTETNVEQSKYWRKKLKYAKRFLQ